MAPQQSLQCCRLEGDRQRRLEMMRSAVVNHRLGIAETRWINRALGSSLHLNPDSGLSVIDRWGHSIARQFCRWRIRKGLWWCGAFRIQYSNLGVTRPPAFGSQAKIKPQKSDHILRFFFLDIRNKRVKTKKRDIRLHDIIYSTQKTEQ